MKTLQRHETDVVVVGGGGAGLRAALEARQAGARVLLVTKGRVGATGATAFGVASLAGYSAADGAGDPLDSPECHVADVLERGAGCADPALVRILAAEAPASVQRLADWGVPFVADGAGRQLIAMGDFASRPRNRKIRGHGRPIVMALKEACAAAGVAMWEGGAVLDLLADDGRCRGVLALDGEGEPWAVAAGATILATGGAGQLFSYSLSPADVTGDGYALGYRAGAELANLEFMQAGFGLVWPFTNMIMAWFWLLAPRFTNGLGEECLARHLPRDVGIESCYQAKVQHYPFSTEDPSRYLEIAAVEEIRAGRATQRQGLFLDLRGVDEAGHIPAGSDIAGMWPLSKAWFESRGVDVMARPLEISVFGHAINGGLRIDGHGRSTLPGLYAVGESAAGPYGADRLGGNMLASCQVFGARAGRDAARVARERPPRPAAGLIRDAAARLGRVAGRPGEGTAAEIKREIQRSMSAHGLVVRSGAGLERCLGELAEIRPRLSAVGVGRARDLVELLEAENLLEVGELMTRAALFRTESRGSHFRADHPQRSAEWACPVFLRREAGGARLAKGCFA